MRGLESTQQWHYFLLITSLSISPWWTLVFLTLSFPLSDIILEALGLFDWYSHDCAVCCNKLPTSQLDDDNHGKWRMQRPDHLKKTKTSYLYTLMLTLRVWVVFSCLLEEDVSALQHGTVFIVIRTGFMTNNDRRLREYVKTLFPPLRDYQVIMHAFVHITVRCSHYRRLYTRIFFFILERK